MQYEVLFYSLHTLLYKYFITLMTTEQTTPVDEDHEMQLKAPEDDSGP